MDFRQFSLRTAVAAVIVEFLELILKFSWSAKNNHFLEEKEYNCCELVLTDIKTPYKAIK